jgi:hypothetical protein
LGLQPVIEENWLVKEKDFIEWDFSPVRPESQPLSSLSADEMNGAKVNFVRRFVFLAVRYGVTNLLVFFSSSKNHRR